MIFRKIHECQRFSLPWIAVGMRTVLGVGVIAVQIHIIGIVADGSGNRIVPSVVGAVRISQGVDVYRDIVNQQSQQAIRAISSQQMMDKPEHQYISSQFIAMHRGSIQEFGFIFLGLNLAGDAGCQ